MATKSILASSSNFSKPNQGLKLSKLLPIEQIEEHPKFKALYHIDEKTMIRISDDMINSSYDNSQPVHIWIYIIDGIEHRILIDGYTRIMAAKRANITSVPYYEHHFATFEEAFRYAIHLQVDRRNLSSADFLANIEVLMGTEYIQNYSGLKAEALAKEMNVSKTTIKKALSVLNEATEEELEEIRNDQETINKLYKKIHAKKSSEKKSSKKTETPDDTPSDALNTNEGTPAPLNFNHSDGQHHSSYDSTQLTPEEDNERTAERKNSYELGFSEGFEKALTFVLAEIISGRTPAEIYHDDRIADLSPSIISKFELPEGYDDLLRSL